MTNIEASCFSDLETPNFSCDVFDAKFMNYFTLQRHMSGVHNRKLLLNNLRRRATYILIKFTILRFSSIYLIAKRQMHLP